MNISLWDDIYNLIISVIGYGSSYPWADYTAQVLATLAVVFVFAVPFIVVYKVIKFITER